MKMKCYIHSIYKATEGEGIWIGTPQVFVRYQGCAIGCLNCDSQETWSFERGESVYVEDVVKRVKSIAPNIRHLSITGGDPLHPVHEESVLELAQTFKGLGYTINLEASGSRIVPSIFDAVDNISFDCKTPSTGVKTPFKNLKTLHDLYAHKSQIKSVIATKHDFYFVLELKKELEKTVEVPVPWVLTPCFNTGAEFDAHLTKEIMHLNYEHGCFFRVIGQQHKVLWGTNNLEI